jgi:hypothetical protein
VTTRGATYRHVPNLALEVLPPDEAVELLQSAGSDVADRDAAEALADRLGHLPLALEVVGALASLPGGSVAGVLAELEDPLVLVEEAADNPFASVSATEHPLSLAETFGPSLRRLDEDSLAVLSVASALNVGPLPTAIVQGVAESVGDVAERRFMHALGMLLSRSLARRVDAESFEVHLLIASGALQWQALPERFAPACLDAAAYHVVTQLGDVEDISTHGPRRRIASFGEALGLSPRHAGGGEERIAMLRALGRFMHIEARLEEAVALERRAVELAAERRDEDPRGALTMQLNYALSLHHAGAPEAEEVVRDALEQLESRFGPDDLDVLTAKHNLASWSRTNEREARALGLQVFEARRRLLGPDHPHTLFSLHSLLAKDVLPDPYPDFVAAYEDLIARRTSVLGPDHTNTLTSISNYSQRLVRLGRPELAVPLARRLAERRAALYGPDHVATLGAKSRLVLALCALPDSPADEIEPLASELAAAVDGIDPYSVYGRHFGLAVDSISTAAVALQQSGRAPMAVALLERTLPTVVDRLGPEDRSTLLLEHNLAAALVVDGRLAEARRRFDELLSRMERSLGADHRLTLRARRQRALIDAGEGRTSDALEAQLRLAEVWEARAGATSAEVAEALGDIADTLDRSGDPSRAIGYRERQRVIAAAVGGGSANWL